MSDAIVPPGQDECLDQLRFDDACAWQAYGDAVLEGNRDAAVGLFRNAVKTLNELAVYERELQVSSGAR